eukprot:2995433-Amphidinium_carterae.1
MLWHGSFAEGTEFEIVPSKGMLLPGCTQRVQGLRLILVTIFELWKDCSALLPSCACRRFLLRGCCSSSACEVDFVSMTEKKYDHKLAVDLEGIGKDLVGCGSEALHTVVNNILRADCRQSRSSRTAPSTMGTSLSRLQQTRWYVMGPSLWLPTAAGRVYPLPVPPKS